MKKKIDISYDPTGETFREHTRKGAEDFPSVWLAANQAMVNSLTYSGMEPHDPAVKEMSVRTVRNVLAAVRSCGVEI